MSVQIPKKSTSLAHFSGLTNKIAHYHHKNYDNKLLSSKSVHAFRQTISSKHKNHINRANRQLQTFSNTQRYGVTNNKRVYYCEQNTKNTINNQTYKQAIQKRKKKSLSISNTSYNKNKNKFNQELLSTIDAFQQTLCSLPLDKLILSENPFYWVEEQIKTLQRLRDKFFRVERTLKEDTQKYYMSKLQNVTKVLMNIKDNLDTLNKMSVLKNYTSGGTSLDSRNSQSSGSLIGMGMKNTTDQKSFKNYKVGLNLNGQISPQFSIESNNDNQNKENQMYQANKIGGNFSKVKLVKSQLKSEQISQKDELILRQYQQQSDCQSEQDVRMIMNCRTQRSFKSSVSQNESDNNYKLLDNNNKNSKSHVNQQQQQPISHTNSNNAISSRQQSLIMRRKHPHSQSNMNKTVSKYHNFLKENNANRSSHQSIIDSQQYSQNQREHQHQHRHRQSKETFNTLENNDNTLRESANLLLGQQTKRHYPISTQLTQNHNNLSIQLIQQAKKLKQQLDIKNDILLKLQHRHQKQLKAFQLQFGRKEKHYLQTIYELNKENDQKQQSIKHLLMEKQEQSQQLQLALKQLKSSIQGKKQLSNKEAVLQSSVETLTNEINKFKVRQDELRETVHLERQRTKKAIKEMQQLQEQIQAINNTLRQKQHQLQLSKTQHLALLNKYQQLELSIEKINSKQDIYKLKYFKLYADFDLFKQKINDNEHYWSKICLSCKRDFIKADKVGDAQKGLELKELINFHKRLLIWQQ